MASSFYRIINILVYRWGYFSFRFIYDVLFRRSVYGKENIPKKGACILAANHSSFLDPPIVGTSSFRKMYYFARSSLMRHPLANLLFKLWNCIPVDRDEPTPGSLKQAIRLLKGGQALILFPEGTRSLDGELQEAKMGVGFIAHKSQAPVVPIYIQGAHQILPKGSKWPRFKKLRVMIGTRLDFQELYQKKGSEEIYQTISNQVMDSIKNLKNRLQLSI